MAVGVRVGVPLLIVWVVSASCGGRELESPLAPSEIPLPAFGSTPVPIPIVDPAPDPPLPAAPAVLVGAGDIAICGALDRADATARVMERELSRGAIGITVGDNSNDDGRPEEYQNCFRPTWGRLNLRPSPGNHDDYDERGHGGAAYFQYFGAQAGPAHQGYYSFDAGSWHVISLNSEIMRRGGGEQAQLSWLRSDLAANAHARCTAAYFHRPMVSSGQFAAHRMRRIWHVLHAAGVDVVLNGHEHFYERFAPQRPTGEPDPAFGIRQFIVGTGGAHFHRAGARARNSEVVIQETFGVIRLTLRASEYDWAFIDTAGTVRDSGTGQCHGTPNPS